MICVYSLVVIGLFLLIPNCQSADDDYNIVHKDGSFEFGYNNPDSYHYADGNRNNVVKGEFGGRNPKTGGIDTTVYTAGPRGFRPRGKNVYRKYNLNQNGPRATGSRDDPYYDPYEDPSYNFAFRTRTYSRQENANRVGDVSGKYTYLDDIGERHNVEYIAGRNTGFHVKTPFPDSNPRAYGPLYFRGRGKPIPRGRTSIQRGLDGSYKFVSAGPDQRRTEVSDSTGHVRGSYTYLDDKGVQHAVHYIAGPETGYRVLKTVKGAHLPTVFPFEHPDIVPSDFYDPYGPEGDVFDTAASGRPFRPGGKPSGSKPSTDLGNGIDVNDADYDQYGDGANKSQGGFGSKRPRPSSTAGTTKRPNGAGSRPGFDDQDEDFGDFGDLFGNGGSGSTTARPSKGRPSSTTLKPTSTAGVPDKEDDGSYKPDGDDGSYPGTTARPGGSTTPFSGYPSGKPSPGAPTLGPDEEYDFNEVPDKGLFGSDSGRPFGRPGGSGDYEGNIGDSVSGGGILQVGDGRKKCPKCTGTIVTNIGYRPFHVAPGVSVRAHVQSIDLYPFEGPSPSEAFRADGNLKTEQLNESSSESPSEGKEVDSSTNKES
ncbi:uncharacterized protein LOC126745714 [Anthonomus grandis grandis]|uniref:uncharacterized protein LOC126745714 n=1 Tax=Anthonomus grandis grandis TaxID=2921223 RepID=UPI002165C086|nr:uncharacterized protein LOC126745714 [Anthonomus grandis grandis]